LQLGGGSVRADESKVQTVLYLGIAAFSDELRFARVIANEENTNKKASAMSY